MQTTQITAATPSIKCSLNINTFLTPKKPKSWHFKPNPTITHTIGTKKTKVQMKVRAKLEELRADKTKQKQTAALRSLTTQTGLRWSFLKNGTLQVGRKFATREQKAQLAALL